MVEMTAAAPPRRAASYAAHATHASPIVAASPLLVRLRLPREMAASRRAVVIENTATKDHGGRSDEGDHDAPTSDSSDTGDVCLRKRPCSNASAGAGSKKRRKPTSTVRKEEKQALLEELAALEARVEHLRERVGLPNLEENRSLEMAQQETITLEETRRTQMLALCRGQSMLSQYMRDLFSGPLKIPIVLGKDPVKRRATLLAVRRPKLDTAYKYLQNRLAGVDDRTPFADNQSWVSSAGDYCFHRTDIIQLEGLRSAKNAYDALVFYMDNLEIAISEQLGQLTLREDLDCVDTRVSNQRLMSSTEHGVVVEINSACFTEYYDAHADHNGEPFGLMIKDSVDVDELYPYCPETRVQRTITAAVSVSSFRRPRTGADCFNREGEGELVVVLRRCAYLCLKKPQFDVSREALDDLCQSVAAWGNVMAKAVGDRAQALAINANSP